MGLISLTVKSSLYKNIEYVTLSTTARVAYNGVMESSATTPVISVFGSSRSVRGDEAYRIALDLGAALARAGYAVASGGYSGVMEAVSRGAAEAGGRAIGVVSSVFSTKANQWVAETIVVPKWEDRLLKLISLGWGCVALPGGTGTLVELAVAWEMVHKRVMSKKPIVVLGQFWRPVVAHIEAADRETRGIVRVANTVADAISALRAAT